MTALRGKRGRKKEKERDGHSEMECVKNDSDKENNDVDCVTDSKSQPSGGVDERESKLQKKLVSRSKRTKTVSTRQIQMKEEQLTVNVRGYEKQKEQGKTTR